MASYRQSFAWWSCCTKGTNPSELIKAAVKIGYKGIEMAPKELWPEIKGAGLQLVSMGAHQSLTDGLNKKENHNRIADEIEKNCELAKKENIHCLIAFSGNRNGLDDEKGAAITTEGLLKCKPIAEKYGVLVVLELLNSKVDHADYQCDKTDWGVKVVSAIKSEKIKLLYDIYHMQIMEGDIIRTIQKHHALFGHYHTAGHPGRRDMDDTQEIHYPGICRAIAATGYTGYLGQEFIPKGDAIQAIEAAYKLCAV
jgi:hydroxypyruvate isomerase